MNIVDFTDEQWFLFRVSAPILAAAVFDSEIVTLESWALEQTSLESEEYFEFEGVRYLPVVYMQAERTTPYFLVVSESGSARFVPGDIQ